MSATASEGPLGSVLCGPVDGGLLEGISLDELLALIEGLLG